jgi:hypothetical protein
MPKIIDREERKESITIRLPKYVIDYLRTIQNYNSKIEQILIKELKIEKPEK